MKIQHPPITGNPALDPWLERLPEQFMDMGWVDVRDFGAVGGGVIDDSTAFYNATVAAAGKAIKIPPNTYLLSTISAKTFDQNIVWIADDPETTILDGGGDQNIYIVKTGYDSYSAHFYGLKFQNFASALRYEAVANIVTHLKVDNCIFYSCDYAGIRMACKVSSAEIINSRFDTIGPSTEAHGVILGTNNYSYQDAMLKYTISGNKFKDITATATPNPARGILCYGREVIITDNIIENVQVGTAEDDAEGIYIKVRFSTISNNILINAGSHQGSIVIKGSPRGATASPQGFANIVANNQLYSTHANTNDVGIFISNDSVLVTGNHLEGFNNTAILTTGNELDDIAIIGNKITRHRGATGIKLANHGRNLMVVNNQITGLLATTAGLTACYGIYLYQTYGTASNIQITNNQIDENDESSVNGIIWGIYARIYSPRTINNLVIQDNQINIVHSTEAERCLQIQCDSGGTLSGLKIKNNQLSVDGTPLTLTFTGTVDGFVYEPMELGVVADMAGHETFTVNDGRVFIKDPDGAARNFNPSGEFPDSFQVTVVNTADDAETITFDSAGLNQAIVQNERGIFVFDGTDWLKVYVG